LINTSNAVKMMEILEEIKLVSQAENNEQFDSDILQCKKDILRARDIKPVSPAPKKKKTEQEAESQENANAIQSTDAAGISIQKEKESREDKTSIPLAPPQVEAIPAKETAPLPKPMVSVDKKEKAEIPKFDLAEEIMAEQRKITAIKRKAPGKKTEAQRSEPQAKPAGYTTIEQPVPTLPEQDQIIAEIVARDIERLCRGYDSADNK
jgi:hypothetical protein